MSDEKEFILYGDEKDIDFESLSILEAEEEKRKIYEQLDEIDKRSVRALRENNDDLLAKYEKKAQELREQLKKLL